MAASSEWASASAIAAAASDSVSAFSGFSPMLANILILKKRRRTVPGKIDQHPRRASASDKDVRGAGKHFEERIIAAAPCPKPDISASGRRKSIDQDIQRP